MEENSNNSIGKKIKKLRKEHKMRQEDLAQLLHVSNKTISKWENDNGMPDIFTVNKLSKIFGVPLNNMVNDDEKLTFKQITKLIYEFLRKRTIHIIFGSAFLFLFIYFISNFETIKVYYVKNKESDIHVQGGYFIESKSKNILVLKNIILYNVDYETVTTKTRLYTLINGDKVYFYEGDDLDSIFIEEVYGYDEIFPKKTINALKKGIYLVVDEIDTEGEVHTYEAKIELSLSFASDKLFYGKKSQKKKQTESDTLTELDEMTLLRNNFEKNEELNEYIKKDKNTILTINLKTEKLTINQKNKKDLTLYELYYNQNQLQTITKNENSEVIKKYIYNFDEENLICYQGNCNSYLEDLEYAKSVLNSIK